MTLYSPSQMWEKSLLHITKVLNLFSFVSHYLFNFHHFQLHCGDGVVTEGMQSAVGASYNIQLTSCCHHVPCFRCLVEDV